MENENYPCECVYFVTETPYCNNVKIGRATNVVLRLSSLQTGNPNKLQIRAIIKTDKSKQLEKELHKELAGYRIHGEWFRLEEDQLSNFINKTGATPFVKQKTQRKPTQEISITPTDPVQDLARFYNINETDITPGFIHKYSSSKIKSIFININRGIVNIDLQDQVENLRSLMKTIKLSVEEINESKNIIKCIFANHILSIITRQQINNYRDLTTRWISRMFIELGIDECIECLRSNVNTLVTVFGLRRSVILNVRKDLKSKLYLVNIILSNTFGIKIIGDRKNNREPLDMFLLTTPELFEYRDERYVIPPREYIGAP